MLTIRSRLVNPFGYMTRACPLRLSRGKVAVGINSLLACVPWQPLLPCEWKLITKILGKVIKYYIYHLAAIQFSRLDLTCVGTCSLVWLIALCLPFDHWCYHMLQDHSHTPWLVIMYKFLEQYRNMVSTWFANNLFVERSEKLKFQSSFGQNHVYQYFFRLGGYK